MSSVVAPTDIVSLMAAVIGAGMTFSLVWFGGRFIVNKVQRAIKGGRLKV